MLSFASVDLAKTNLTDGLIESKTEGKPFGIEIGFTTDNVASVYKDNDGFLIEICSPME